MRFWMERHFVGLNHLQRGMGAGNISKSKPSPSGDTLMSSSVVHIKLIFTIVYENKRHQLDL